MIVRFIGDVHGKIEQYLKKIEGVENSIQVGDVGLGFRGVHVPRLPVGHHFLRGNHDDPAAHAKHFNYIGDYGMWDSPKLFYLSGAFSIDYMYRLSGVSWWPDEELSDSDLASASLMYVARKPDYVVTHDCPAYVRHTLLSKLALGFRPEKDLNCRTSSVLQYMFEAHKPKIWVFGHYHLDMDFVYEGCRFICLNELSTIDLELEANVN